MLQSLIILSQLPVETKYLLSGEKATELTEPMCPLSLSNYFSGLRVNKEIVSLEPSAVAKYLPSGENARHFKSESSHLSVVISLGNSILHSLIVLSRLQEANYLLSFEKAKEQMDLV
jgi:hypothetical protein